MRNPTDDTQSSLSGWSNRILFAAIAGILFLTLYPFRFEIHRELSALRSPFLLGPASKHAGALDAFLNILLFVPFGFGLAEKLRERGKSRSATFAITLVAGALFSYGIELTQLYIPPRNSGWEDVFTNTTGSIAGFVLFQLLGAAMVRLASQCERAFATWLSWKRAAMILALFFAAVCAISIPLQKETRLSNWDPNSSLLVGNPVMARYAWKGSVALLQVWDRALPGDIARKLTAGDSGSAAAAAPLGAYDFSSPAPFRDEKRFLPDLSWAPGAPENDGTGPLVLNGKSWLASQGAVAGLVDDFRKTNQFSLRIICVPAERYRINADIVSISLEHARPDLSLRQEGSDLVFWFRTPLSVKRSLLAWRVPRVFTANQRRDILYSYDGSDLSLYMDGKQMPRAYRLGPGVALAQLLRRIRPSQLEAVNYVFYALVFLPLGMILGIAARGQRRRDVRSLALFVAVAFLFPVLLEFFLVRTSGRAISAEALILSLVLVAAGCAWINADGKTVCREP